MFKYKTKINPELKKEFIFTVQTIKEQENCISVDCERCPLYFLETTCNEIAANFFKISVYQVRFCHIMQLTEMWLNENEEKQLEFDF